jgi:hypothetical protein
LNAETLKRAYRRTLEDQRGFDPDIAGSRRAAVKNVKNTIIRQHKTNAIVDEWLNAKEEHKKWSLR